MPSRLKAMVALPIAAVLGFGLAAQLDAEPAPKRNSSQSTKSRPAAVAAKSKPVADSGVAVLNPAVLKARAQAQARILGTGSEIEDVAGKPTLLPAAAASGRENGHALGRFVPIENESALAAFHSALAELESGKLKGGKLRILVYGASHTQGDVYPSYLRYYLQSRFGDGGRGFVQMAKLDKRYHTIDLAIESSGFSIQHAQHNADARGRFGLMGASAVATSRAAFASIRQKAARRTSVGAVDLSFYAMGAEDGGDLKLSIDGKQLGTWPTARATPETVVHSTRAATGFSDVSIKPVGNGSVRLFGVAVERPTPGIVVDTLGISGTRAANWLTWNEALWAEQVKLRNPALVTLAYGTNEATDEHQPIERYERDLERVLARLKRAAPGASCLLIGPADVAKKVRGVWTERRRIGPVIEVQRRLALANGCGFWDARRSMGDGGIGRWHRAAPRMAAADHVHLTRRGYVKIAIALGDALLRAYDGARSGSR